MKKTIIGVIVFSVIFFFGFSSGFSQTSDKLTIERFPNGLVYLKGWVKYDLKHTTSNQILRRISSGLICKLKSTNIYKIHSIKLNNITYGPPYNHVFEIPANTGFECSVGQLLEIKLGLIKKNSLSSQIPVYYTIAKFKVNNLFRNHVFPEPNQEIDPNADTLPYYLFRWKFTNFPVKTNLRMSALGVPGEYLNDLRGESCKIYKNKLPPGADYLLFHYSLFQNKDNKFTLLEPVTSDSGMTFTFYLTQHFKVKNITP